MRSVGAAIILALGLSSCNRPEPAEPPTPAASPSPSPTHQPCPESSSFSQPTVWKATIDPAVDAWKGPADALVTLVVFSDFEDKHCKDLEATLAQIEKAYPGKIRQVFKHAPLVAVNPHAEKAARLALCAQKQGKFWEMHDDLFKKQHALDSSGLQGHARATGLDLATLEICATGSPDLEKRIRDDQRLAESVSARGVPNTFVNGRKVTGSKSLAEFRAVIDAELTAVAELRAHGVAAADTYAERIRDARRWEPLGDRVDPFRLDGVGVDGRRDAPISIVEFGDVEDGFTGRAGTLLRSARLKYGDRVVTAWKNYPLSFHPLAREAAEGAACAGEQGKLWAYLDECFAVEREKLEEFDRLLAKYGGDGERITDGEYSKRVAPLALTAEKLAKFPANLGLDVSKFEECMSSGRGRAVVDADIEEAKLACVRGTPTFFINGRMWRASAGYSIDTLHETLEFSAIR